MSKDFEINLDDVVYENDCNLSEKQNEIVRTKRLIEMGILNEQGHPAGCGCESCGGAG
jgi:hypothetical protein